MSRAALCDAVELVREQWREAWDDREVLRFWARCGFGGLIFFVVVELTHVVLRIP